MPATSRGRKAVGALLDNPQVRFEAPRFAAREDSNGSSGYSTRREATDRQQVSHSLVLGSVGLGGNDRRYARAGFSESRRECLIARAATRSRRR